MSEPVIVLPSFPAAVPTVTQEICEHDCADLIIRNNGIDPVRVILMFAPQDAEGNHIPGWETRPPIIVADNPSLPDDHPNRWNGSDLRRLAFGAKFDADDPAAQRWGVGGMSLAEGGVKILQALGMLPPTE